MLYLYWLRVRRKATLLEVDAGGMENAEGEGEGVFG